MKEERMITVKGKTYPCRVTMGAMVRFKRACGRDVSELGKNDVSDMVLFMWCCVASACKADDVAFDMSFDDFADALEPSGLQSFYSEMQSAEKKTLKEA